MGTTLVGVAMLGARLHWFNVGDSRIYLWRGHLQQLSVDHVPKNGGASARKRTHAITQSIGGSPIVADIWPASGFEDIRPGDILLLCTDGISDMVSDLQLEIIAASGSVAEVMLGKIVDAVKSGGAVDNFSLVVVIVHEYAPNNETHP
jgi:protein phosphatase